MSNLTANSVTLGDIQDLASRLNLQTDPGQSALQRKQLIERLTLWISTPECFQNKEAELYAQEIQRWL